MRNVEIDHLKTSIIALHQEFKVVEDERKDVETKREKEEVHRVAAETIGRFLERTLQVQQAEEEEKNKKLEEMLA